MLGFPGGSGGKESSECWRPWFCPWVGKIPWRREWLSTPGFLPEEIHGQRILVSYSPCGHKELDMAEQLTLILLLFFIHLSGYNSIKITNESTTSIGSKFFGGQGFLKIFWNLIRIWKSLYFRRWASLIAQLVNNLPALHETPGSERSARERIGYSLQYSLASLVD